MNDSKHTVGQFLGGDLEKAWEARRDKLHTFLASVGITGDEWHQSLYIFPYDTKDPDAKIESLQAATADGGRWLFIKSSRKEGGKCVIAFPVASHYKIKSENDISRALFVDVHSRMIAWWLTYAWRSQQLASATWQLGDAMQIIPAAACARSLLETAAALWVDAIKLRKVWLDVKQQCAGAGEIAYEQYHAIAVEIWKIMWRSKFTNKAPELNKRLSSEHIEPPVISKLLTAFSKAYDGRVHEHYAWLCNAVHPSIGGMFAFAGPLLVHKERTCAVQSLAPFPIALVGNDERRIENTIQRAIVSAAVLSVDVLTQVLDDALHFIDDIALTTRAPQATHIEHYWRCLKAKPGRLLCPCRSGRLGRACDHMWSTVPPPITQHFETIPGTA